jgi:hypothetical protein
LCGLSVAGSWITNEIDQYSDLDLIVVCEDGDFTQILKDRFKITKSLGDHLSSFTGEHVGEPRLLISLFRNPLIHVDVKFVALKDFHDRIENPYIAWERDGKLTEALKQSSPHVLKPDAQWIEDRFWTWIHYCGTKIGRGEIFEAIGCLNFLRETVLAPLALWLHHKPVRGIRKIEQHLPEFAQRLQATVPVYDRASCLMALQAVVEIYRELRTQNLSELVNANPRAEKEALQWLSRL